MGAFFLFKSEESIDINSAQRVFDNKGFTKPEQFTLNNMTLWLYKKQLVEVDNFCFSEKGSAIFVNGTVVYKGKSYRDSLLSLLNDFERNRVDYDDITGAFCIIFFLDQKIYFLTDRCDIYHIFINKSKTILSSSFLALISAQNRRFSLNRLALLENIFIGYVSGPDTLLNDISLVNNLYKQTENNTDFTFMSWPEKKEDEICFNGFKEDANLQLNILKKYYKKIRSLALDYGIDIGLSGGYDSRLNFLLANTQSVNIKAHTHCSSGHTEEIKIAKMLAEEKDIHLSLVPISCTETMTEEEITGNLFDSLNFFDGRNNKTMGTFNDVHTRRYRVRVLNGNVLALNGLGGEIYRNYNYTYYNKLNFKEWIKYHVISPFVINSCSKNNTIEELISFVSNKYCKILNIDYSKFIKKIDTRQFFTKVWIPYSAGIKSQAENQLTFFLMPFTDFFVMSEALKATPHIGVSGKFEAAMIKALDKNLASIQSSHGFNFIDEPFLYTVKSSIKCFMPDRIKNVLGLLKAQYMDMENKDRYTKNIKRHSVVQQSLECLYSLNIPINWESLFLHRSHFERSIFVGYFLLKYSGKISLERW